MYFWIFLGIKITLMKVLTNNFIKRKHEKKAMEGNYSSKPTRPLAGEHTSHTQLSVRKRVLGIRIGGRFVAPSLAAALDLHGLTWPM